MADKRRKADLTETMAVSVDQPERAHADEMSRPAPAEDAIARRAYELYEQRGGGDGRDLEDWLQAEEELRPR